MSNDFMLYGVIDKSTGKLVSNITNPRHKYWESRKRAESAIKNYNPKYLTSHFRTHNTVHNPEDLEVVEIYCKVGEARNNG